MDCTPIKIELKTEIGNFKFEEHFNSTADFYQAMCLFESNNWRKLGEVSYKLFLKFTDGTITETVYDGVNGSCYLAETMESFK